MRNLVFLLALLTGCYLHSFPVTENIVETSTYKATTTIPDVGAIQGTAWVVDRDHLVTAGHMCDYSQGAQIVLESLSGRKFPATPVAWEMDEAGEADLCILKTDAPLGTPLILGSAPSIGAPVETVGFPHGHFNVSTGTYLGDNESDAWSTHGASGSSVYTPGGVIGVLVQGRHDNSPGIHFTPVSELKDFLDDNNIPYQLPPVMPEEMH